MILVWSEKEKVEESLWAELMTLLISSEREGVCVEHLGENPLKGWLRKRRGLGGNLEGDHGNDLLASHVGAASSTYVGNPPLLAPCFECKVSQLSEEVIVELIRDHMATAEFTDGG